MILQDLIDFVIQWFRSRNWLVVSVLLLPFVLLWGVAIGLVVSGWSVPTSTLVAFYIDLAEEELVASQSESDDDDDEDATPKSLAEATKLFQGSERISPDAALLLRRVLQIESFNHRATFLVALDLSRKGRAGTARQMMRKIAPAGKEGFQAAHAWLVADRVGQNRALEDEEKETFLADLGAASEWKAASPEMLLLYADALTAEGDVDSAVNVLKSRANDFPELQVKIAELAVRTQNERDFIASSAATKRLLSERIKEGKAQPGDFSNLAKIYFFGRELDTCIKVAQAGLRVHEDLPENEQEQQHSVELKRILSEAFRVKYRMSMKRTLDGKTSIDLGMLDESLKADPTNPNAIQDVAEVVANGGNASPEMLAVLRENLADGTASAITHLILANSMLSKGKSSQAIPHLEMALKRAPDNPVALNNLAVALLKQNPDRALEVVDKALKLAGPNASMLDTKGQVLEELGDTSGAIVCYEDAILHQQDKINTRQRLVNAYRKAGMVDMAKEQAATIQRLKKGPTVAPKLNEQESS